MNIFKFAISGLIFLAGFINLWTLSGRLVSAPNNFYVLLGMIGYAVCISLVVFIMRKVITNE